MAAQHEKKMFSALKQRWQLFYRNFHDEQNFLLLFSTDFFSDKVF